MARTIGAEQRHARPEAEISLPSLTARLMRFQLDRPTNHLLFRPDSYWLDMCLTPRPAKARACYRDRWGPHRYDRLGDIFLVPPNHAMHARSDHGGDQISIICEIGCGFFRDWLEEDFEWTDRRLEATLDIVSPHIRAALFRLAEELRQPGFGSQVMAELLTGQIAIEVSRYCKAVTEGPITGGLATWRLRMIDDRLQETGSPATLRELAELCNMSVRQMTRGFRTSKGVSVGDYVAQVRIEQAKRLLGTDESIKSIGFAMGFASPSSFSFAFRQATGSTPRQYRQRQLRRYL